MPRVGDYSSARPDPGMLRRDGFESVGRYLGFRGDSRALTRPELDALHAAGISVWLIREDHGGEALEGFDSGLRQGQIARQLADQLGWPGDRPVYATADVMVLPSQYGAVGAYLDGFGQGLGGRPVGLYGGARLIQWAMANGHASWGWAAGASSWHDRVAPVESGAQIEQFARQLYGGAVDDGRSLAGDWGAWHPDISYEHGKWDDMATASEIDAVFEEKLKRLGLWEWDTRTIVNQATLTAMVRLATEMRDLLAPIYAHLGIELPPIDVNDNLPNEPIPPPPPAG
jgi:hypothetical protein